MFAVAVDDQRIETLGFRPRESAGDASLMHRGWNGRFNSRLAKLWQAGLDQTNVARFRQDKTPFWLEGLQIYEMGLKCSLIHP
jgi:hypothetical protein